jgi:hypothetical protein
MSAVLFAEYSSSASLAVVGSTSLKALPVHLQANNRVSGFVLTNPEMQELYFANLEVERWLVLEPARQTRMSELYCKFS